MDNEKKLFFIDIIYYNCYSFYKRYEKDINEFSGQALTSLCLSLNIGTLIIVVSEVYQITLFENKWYTLLITLPIMAMVIIRYEYYISISEIEDLLLERSKKKRNFLSLISFLYVVLSIVGCLILVIILGEINNPPPFWENWFS